MNHVRQNYQQGYKSTLSREKKKIFRELYCGKSLWNGILLTLANLLGIYMAVGISYVAFQQLELPHHLALIVLPGLIFAARQMRALESIVHFGSHSNFCPNRTINDQITNFLAAWPMLQDVKQYRIFHQAHHGGYGSHDDPCKKRLERIGALGLEINNNRQLVVAILKWMPSYVREYYFEVKSSSIQVIVFLAWHMTVMVLLALLLSWQLAAFCGIFWAISMFLILPFLRSIAEFSEHDYQRGDTVRETTFNNLGLLDHMLLHPAGDAWHALHHLHPTVPWWKQRAAHRFLIENDQAYREFQHRDNLFQDIADLPAAAS